MLLKMVVMLRVDDEKVGEVKEAIGKPDEIMRELSELNCKELHVVTAYLEEVK